jgi:hypothetical protein
MKPRSPTPLRELGAVIAALEPALRDGVYAFTTIPQLRGPEISVAIAMIREAEGVTLVLPLDIAEKLGVPVLFKAAWLTLNVHSDLHAIGLTATVATSLAAYGISCNVIAGAHHDHLFVPHEKAEEALRVVKELQGMRED